MTPNSPLKFETTKLSGIYCFGTRVDIFLCASVGHTRSMEKWYWTCAILKFGIQSVQEKHPKQLTATAVWTIRNVKCSTEISPLLPLPPPKHQEWFGSTITTTELKLFIVLNRKHLQTFLAHSIKTDLSNSVFFREVLICKSKSDISRLYITTSNSNALCVRGISSDWGLFGHNE